MERALYCVGTYASIHAGMLGLGIARQQCMHTCRCTQLGATEPRLRFVRTARNARSPWQGEQVQALLSCHIEVDPDLGKRFAENIIPSADHTHTALIDKVYMPILRAGDRRCCWLVVQQLAGSIRLPCVAAKPSLSTAPSSRHRSAAARMLARNGIALG